MVWSISANKILEIWTFVPSLFLSLSRGCMKQQFSFCLDSLIFDYNWVKIVVYLSSIKDFQLIIKNCMLVSGHWFRCLCIYLSSLFLVSINVVIISFIYIPLIPTIWHLECRFRYLFLLMKMFRFYQLNLFQVFTSLSN